MTTAHIKKLYALRGLKSIGKSQALRNLIPFFLQVPRNCVIYSAYNKNDILVAFNYKGVQIGIGTEGDNISALKNNLNFFRDQECVIGVTAWSNNEGSSATRFFKENPLYKPEVIDKEASVGKDFDMENLEMAEHIFMKIDQYISKIKY